VIKPQPVILLTEPRTGGTFLAGCLSNHTDIFCARGEPFHRGSRWGVACQDEVERLELIWTQQHYRVCMCKLMRNHALRERVWEHLMSREPPVKIIYLTREDIVKQGVSIAINIAHRSGKMRDHPTHTFETVHPQPVTLDPYDVFNWCRSLTERHRDFNQRLVECGLLVMRITYEQITGDAEVSVIGRPIAEEICQFLEVPYQELHYSMRKLHREPMAQTVANWDELVAFLRSTEFASYVETSTEEQE